MRQESLSLEEFQERFSTEEACQEYLFGIRWPEGYSGPRCGHDRYYFHGPRHLYECKACRYQVSLTAGTIFHGTRTPLRKWFWMIFLRVPLLLVRSYAARWSFWFRISEELESSIP